MKGNYEAEGTMELIEPHLKDDETRQEEEDEAVEDIIWKVLR